MTSPWNFGISQEDARTELAALSLESSDRLLAVASAGEVPLNLAALSDAEIVAVDTSPAQLMLCELKWTAATKIEPDAAAKFLGYMAMEPQRRKEIFKILAPSLAPATALFWNAQEEALAAGIVGQARFEKYLRQYNWLALRLLGQRHLRALLDYETREEQQEYFDKNFRTGLLRLLFKIAFHPRVYKKRGMDEQGLTHGKERDIAAFFFDRFRDFCTATPARKNYYYQYSFFNQITHSEGLPEYLTEKGVERLCKRKSAPRFVQASYTEHLLEEPPETYNKFHLSNIGDWMDVQAFEHLWESIAKRSAPQGKGILRYIHKEQRVPESLSERISLNLELGELLTREDRYPFYTIVPFEIFDKAQEGFGA
ncbi:DUF3419 family protein [Myxococcota bacterium]|nr:DUF3419 family protein [Myxococcota bacterium]